MHKLEPRPWMWFVFPFTFLCNTEVVMAPVAIYSGFAQSFWVLAVAMAITGGSSLIFYYFFIDQVALGAQHLPLVQRAMRFSKGVFRYLEQVGVIRLIIGHVKKFLGELNGNHKNTKRLLYYLEPLGLALKCIALFGLAFLPIPFLSAFLWVPALVACRLWRSPLGLACMIMGDTSKNLLFAYAWWQISH